MRAPLFASWLIVFPALAIAGDEKTLLVEAFDGAGPKIGMSWETYIDDNKLGTTVKPFAVGKGGSPKGAKGHGHSAGHIGKSKDPWPWAVLDLAFGLPSLTTANGLTV